MSDIVHGAGNVRQAPKVGAISQPQLRQYQIPQKHFAIDIKPENQGTLTSLAQRHGKTPLEMAYYIKQHPEKYDVKWQRRATFCINASKWKKGGK
jgi:hypothetical protein